MSSPQIDRPNDGHHRISNFDSNGNYVWTSHTAALIMGNLIINSMDLVAFCLMIMLWKYKKNPFLTIRRPGLLLFNVLFFFLYDFIWTLDNILWEVTGGIPCTYWEWARSLSRVIFLEILLLRAWVLFAAFNLTVLADKALKRTSVFEQAAGLRLRPENVIKLKKYKKFSKAKFLRRIIAVLICLHSIPFVVQWIARPELFDTPFDHTPACFVSPAYYFNFYFQVLLGVIALIFAWNLKLVQDSLHIKRELIMMALYWISYNIMIFITNFLPNHDVSSVWLWVIFDFIFYYLFVYNPVKEVIPNLCVWRISFEKFERDGESATNVSRFSSKNIQSLKDLKQYRKASRLFRHDGQTGEFLTLLHDPHFFEAFRQFLADELAAENLLFWKHVQDYRFVCSQIHTAEFSEEKSEEKKMEVLNHCKATAKQIYEIYMAEDASLEINLPSRLFNLYREIPWEDYNDYDLDLFDPAEKEIVQLMRINFFERFRKTEAFQSGKFRAIIAEEETIVYEVAKNKGMTRTASLGITRTMSYGDVGAKRV